MVVTNAPGIGMIAELSHLLDSGDIESQPSETPQLVFIGQVVIVSKRKHTQHAFICGAQEDATGTFRQETE